MTSHMAAPHIREQARKAWYASHGILPWDDGGGTEGTLVWSDENVSGRGIDSRAVRQLARKILEPLDGDHGSFRR